ncbi:dioxygenase family protein [Streptomyces specialis]|uniref:dioxygenase family protein n=1 Tax=Streptomyces specialis TaxID=498367 RepID=UPI00073E7AD5|nr:hypothetical protein [Streptomyces specialis]
MTTDEFVDVDPPFLFPDYPITRLRAPLEPPVVLPRGWFHHQRGPAFGRVRVLPGDNDLTTGHPGVPIGQRIILRGRVLDSDGRGVPGTLIEIWQANAAGRYVDRADPGYFPLDPNFTGAGRTLTDNGGNYRFTTIKPAAYPGAPGTWYRPAHIHVSLFGPSLGHRLITQCYFEGDPLIAGDPIARSIPDPRALDRLVAKFSFDQQYAGGSDSAMVYDWDIVLRGPATTPVEG